MAEASNPLKRFLSQISNTKKDELPCDDVFDLLDVYADAQAKGEDPSVYLPLVKHHLEMCRDCFEEYESLMAILENE
jgi:hypothetical protein